MDEDTYVLHIVWEREDMPPTVGPFASREEAVEWGALNIPNGVWDVSQMTYPYLVVR